MPIRPINEIIFVVAGAAIALYGTTLVVEMFKVLIK